MRHEQKCELSSESSDAEQDAFASIDMNEDEDKADKI